MYGQNFCKIFFDNRLESTEVKGKKTVKKHYETRWSSYYNAVEVIQENFDKIISCLKHFEGGKFSSETKSDAYLLLHSLQQLPLFLFKNFGVLFCHPCRE